MKLEHIRFIREILIRDHRGRRINTLQISYAKPEDLNPTFRNVAKPDRPQVQALYHDLGGGRLKKWWVGLTVVVPLDYEDL